MVGRAYGLQKCMISRGAGFSMKETVLLYNFSDPERLKKAQRALLPLGVRVKKISREDYLQPVGYLAGVKETGPVDDVYDGDEFDKEMVVMAGLSSKRIDAVIDAFKRAGVGRIDYKAVLTDTNEHWTSVRLYNEISGEHEALKGGE